jgi:hypothetical protein
MTGGKKGAMLERIPQDMLEAIRRGIDREVVDGQISRERADAMLAVAEDHVCPNAGLSTKMFTAVEIGVEKEVAEGRLSREKADAMLDSARIGRLCNPTRLWSKPARKTPSPLSCLTQETY